MVHLGWLLYYRVDQSPRSPSLMGQEEGNVLLSYRQSSQSASKRPQNASTPTLRVEEYRAAYPWVANLVYVALRREVPADPPGPVVLRLGDTVLRLEGSAELTEPGLPTVIAANLAGR